VDAEVAHALGQNKGGPKEFADFLLALFAAQDEAAEISRAGSAFEITQPAWKLMADVGDDHPACARVLAGLFEGLAFGCGRHIPVDLRRSAGGKPPFVWTIGA